LIRAFRAVAAGLASVVLLMAGPAEAVPGQVVLMRPLSVNQLVEGDIVSIGGHVRLGPKARVRGDVISLFGTVEKTPGAVVEGRVVQVSSLAAVDAAALAPGASNRVLWGLRALMAGLWLLMTTITALLFPVPVGRAAWLARRLSWRVIVIGVLMGVTLVAALVACLGLGPGLGLPLIAAVAAVFFSAKVFGLTVLGTVLGRWLSSRFLHRRQPVTVEVFAGVVVLLILRYLPLVGGPLWILASIWGLGAGVVGVTLRRSVLTLGVATNQPSHRSP